MSEDAGEVIAALRAIRHERREQFEMLTSAIRVAKHLGVDLFDVRHRAIDPIQELLRGEAGDD